MSQPKLLSKPWATDGLKNDIPTVRDTGLAQEAATYTEGFPSITMTPISVGGKPPSGKDMNGILYEVSAHIVYTNKGQRYCFDQTFCTSIGGYPKGAVLMNDAGTAEYISLIDRNTANFNLTTVNIAGKWAIYAGEGAIPAATTTGRGLTQLSSATNSNAEDCAATPKAIKTVLDALTNLDGRSFKQYGALSSRNLNDLKGDANYGVWHQTDNTAATPERNYPTTKAGTLYVLPSAYSGQQIYYPLDQNVFYKRHSLPDGSWSAWHTMCEIIDSSSSTSTTAAASANQVKRLNDRAANIENTKFDKAGGTVTGHIAAQYLSDWVSFAARNPTEGKHGCYDVHVGGYNRGGFAITGVGNGEYRAQIRITAPGEVAQDRHTVGMEIRHNEIVTQAYGKLHEAFVRANGNVLAVGNRAQESNAHIDFYAKGTNSGDYTARIINPIGTQRLELHAAEGTKIASTLQVTAPASDANNDQVPTTAWVRGYAPSKSDLNNAAPSGEIAFFARNAAPAGWLKANGAAVSRTTYAALFAAIGTTFGAGDGSTTFNLPDLRGEFLRSWDDGRGVDAGRAFGTRQADDLKSHTHGGVPLKRNDTDRGVGNSSLFTLDIEAGETTATGGSETRPRNIALLACIKI